MSDVPPPLPNERPSPPAPPQVVVNVPGQPKWTRRFGRAVLVLSILLNVVLLVALSEAPVSLGVSEQRYSGPADAESKIAVIGVDGVIDPSVVATVRSRLQMAMEDAAVKAVVLRLASPGGGITSSDTLYHIVAEADKKKPVIASMADVAASGAYYAAAGCRHIMAQRTSITGSIGVIMTLPNVRKLLGEKLGVEMSVLTAGEMKDAGSPFKELTDADRAYFQGLVDDAFARFKEVVRTGRNLSKQEIDLVADGSVCTGPKAQQLKLVDSIGYLDDAIERARQEAGIVGDPLVIRYHRPFGLLSLLMGAAAPPKIDIQLGPKDLHTFKGGRLMYLWAPGALETASD